MKQISKLVFGGMAVMCQRAGNVSHAGKGGTSDHATQPLVISISQPQVTKMYLFQVHLLFESLLASASITLCTAVIPFTAFPC